MKLSITILFILLMTSCSFIRFSNSLPSKQESLLNPNFKWQSDSTAHFYFFYDINSISQTDVDLAKVRFEAYLPELLRFLDLEKYDSKLNLFMVESREKMAQLVGRKTNGIANSQDNTVYSIFNDHIKTFGKHEFCHVITHNKWGKPNETWISEGLAVNSDNTWWGHELHALANYLRHQNRLYPIRELIDNFRSLDDLISYPEAGSFVRFIHEKYGLQKLKLIWTNGVTNTFESKSISDLEREWLEEIQKYDFTSISYQK